MTRTRLLSGTALIGIMTLALLPGQANAACDINVPTAGQTVTCTGTDTTGVSGGANNVQVNVEGLATVSTTGVNAIELGTGGVVDIKFGTAGVSSNLTAINMNGGTIFANGTINGGNGTAINFGSSNANLNIYSATNITGNIIVGGANDQFRLRNSGGTLNVSDIGAKYLGFDQFEKSDAGTWTLTGTGNQSWTVSAGSLQGDTTSMSGNLAVSSGANVTFDQSTNGSTSGIISGAGSLTKSGIGTLTLSTANSFSGGLIISAGQVAATPGTLGAGNVANSGTLSLNTGSNSTYNGIISGTGNLIKQLAGTVTLTGASTYTGSTSILGGALNISADNNIGAASSNLTLNGGTLQSGAAYTNSHAISLGASGGTIDTNGFATTASGIISGAGSLTKSGTGTLSLSGANTYTGGTNLTAGTLEVSSSSALGTGQVAISNNAVLLTNTNNINNSISLGTGGGTIRNVSGVLASLQGVISGTGNLAKTGANSIRITGNNTYTGGTNISGGSLWINSATSLGAESGDLTLSGGNILYEAGFSSSRNVILSSGGSIDTNGFNSTMSGIISGSGALTKSGTGTLTLSGTNTYSGGTTIANGTISASADNNLGTGSITLNGGTLRSGAAYTNTHAIALGASNGTIDTNGFSTVASGVISGTGSLTKTGTGSLAMTGNNTYSGGTSISAGNLNVTTSSLPGNVANSGTLAFSQAGAGTYTGIVSGSGNINYGGGGNYTVTGANTYTGSTAISNATVNATADNNFGAGTALTINNGTLQYEASFSSTKNISVASGGGTFNTNGFNSTLSGIISGAGTLTKTGTGTLTLTGTNTYSGGTTVSGGTIKTSADANLGNVSGTLTLNGGTMQYGSTFTSGRVISLGASGGTIDTQGTSPTISGVISGTGSLTKLGTGQLSLTGSNSYTGNTIVNEGILQVNTSAALGSASNTLTLNGGTLRYSAGFTTSRSVILGAGNGTVNTNGNNAVLSGTISGSGSLTKINNGVLALSGTNTYTGGTTISSGTVSVSADANLGNTSGILTLDGGTLAYGAAFTSARSVTLGAGNGTVDTGILSTTLSGVISGTGSLTKVGSGSLILSGANTYTGGTVITAGRLQGTTTSLQGDILNNASLRFAQGSDGTYSGAISGTGNVEKISGGTVTLTGINTYSGGTTISVGGLAGTTDSLQGAITNNAAVTFDQSANGTYAGIMSGTGTLTKTGTGTLTFSGSNNYSGGTTVTAGRLSVNGTIVGTTTVASAGTLGGSGNFGTIVANGRIAPGNSIGTMNVTGPVTFNSGSVYEVEVDAGGNSDKLIATGTITINGGTVDVRAASGSYTDNTVYNNILQGSSVTGTFSGVTSDLAFLTPTLSYDATSVDLTLARNDVDFNAVAQDEVQAGVANAVQGLGSGNDLYTAFSGLNMQEASVALDTLSGEHNAGITTATAQSASIIQNVVLTRVQNLGSNNIASISPAAGDNSDIEIKKNFWSEVFGSRGHSDAQGTAPAQNRESSGALFGGDAEFSNDIFAGVFGGYEIGEVYTDTQNANSDVNSYHAGIYASKKITSSWRISTSLIGSYHNIDTTRHIAFTGFSETPKGNTSGYTITPSLETGYSFDVNGINLEPFAGLSLFHSYIDSYSEQDGGSANLDVDSVSQTNASHMLGLRLNKSVHINDETAINLSARAGWNHIYGDLDISQTMQFSAGTTPFDVKGAGLSRNSVVFGAGADIALGFSDATAYLNYAGEASKDADNHGVTVGIKIPF